MKLLFLAYAFPPLEVSGSLRSRSFAEHFPHSGIDPVIVCADPGTVASHYPGSVSYVDGWTDDSRWQEVVRIPWAEAPDARSPIAGLALRLPLVATAVRRSARAARVARLVEAGRSAIERHRPRAVYCSVAPATTALAGEALAREFGLPLIVDIRDPWSYGPPAPYRHYLDFLLERRVERRTLNRAQLVVTPTHAAKRLLAEKLSISAGRILTVQNGFEDDASPLETGASLEPGVFTILHAGEAGTGGRPERSFRRTAKRLLGIDYDPMHRDFSSRSLEAPISALGLLLDRRPDLRDRIRLHFLGLAPERASITLARARYADRISVQPRVPRRESESQIRRADALLLMQVSYWLDGRPFCPAVPAKLYSYLAAGAPILAVAQQSEITAMIEEENAGIVVPPGNHMSLSRAMETLVDDWIHGGRRRYFWNARDRFTRRALAGELAARIRAISE